MKSKMKMGVMIVLSTLVVLGSIVAQEITKPMNVSLQTHIEVCKKTDTGEWEVVDEIGPATLQFPASLAELATSDKKLSSAFVWNTKSKKGVPYSVKLAQPANVKYNPVSGQLDGDVKLDVTWNGKKSVVTSRMSTESVSGPRGSLRGARAKGFIGKDPITAKLVSANDLALPGEASLKLVCTESYTLTPQRIDH